MTRTHTRLCGLGHICWCMHFQWAHPVRHNPEERTGKHRMSSSTTAGVNGGARAPMTSFVGRRRELADAKAALAESRLVTLTGPGGVGKTRLSLEVAEKSRRAFRHGVWRVELATLEDGGGLASTVLSALAVPDQSNRPARDKLADHLGARQLLIVLDNCEHLLQPVADLLASLLPEAPGVRVLATSREPLGIGGERICLLPPLSTPSIEDARNPQGLEQFEAVRLLVDRARSVDPGFAVTAENSASVVQLCHRLDGIPLAIELAASRLRSLTVTQFVQRLDKRFQLLTGGDRTALPRQQTLRALIDWSYDLCTEAEKLLWARLTVFPGSFSLEAAEEVCGFDELKQEDVLDVLDRLVAKSLLITERGREKTRYRQLMTVREYGAELLAKAGQHAAVKQRHRDHYLHRAASMVSAWCGPHQAMALADMREDHPNVLSALEWSTSTPGEYYAGAELASMLRYHWIAGGFLSDGRRWLDRALLQAHEPAPERGAALWVAAWVALIQGDRNAAAAYLDECRQLSVELPDPSLQAPIAHWSGLHQMFSGNLSSAIELFQHAVHLHTRTGDTGSALAALYMLATAQTYSSTGIEEALDTCRHAMTLSNDHGERWSRAYTLWISGVCYWKQGDTESARQAALQALELQKDFKDSICTALSIELLSWIAASADEVKKAEELALAASTVWKELGTTVAAFGPHIQGDSQLTATRIADAVGSTIAIAEEGTKQLTKDAAIDLALGRAEAPASPDAPASPLTKREQEIALLIAKGLSNRAIGDSLVISPRTVGGHVESILAKLGFTSRTQVASWVASRAVSA
ncbi:LuxR C-terminal-related transcriptional regulator [Arthrobacter sp. NPDC089319]|uniref:ATP-binding protein n=1 Tax=Arthrobacter sp. NPDC089319 TaxID=3155915 RepID=UPI003416622A